MCKKGEIVQENIEMQMCIVTRVTASEDDSFDEQNDGSSDEEDNGDFMARCQGLTYNVEIGELHERDKFTWVESRGVSRRKLSVLEEKKLKSFDFKFKLNHIKQVVSFHPTYWSCSHTKIDKILSAYLQNQLEVPKAQVI